MPIEEEETKRLDEKSGSKGRPRRNTKRKKKRGTNNTNSKQGNTSGENRHIHGNETENGANDVNWYTHIYGVSEPLTRVSFNIMTGLHYNPVGANARPAGGEGAWNVVATDDATVDPGILRLRILPVLGDATAANTAATQIYSLMRQANSGAKNYDKTDLMMMILAMDNAYMVYEYLLRAYRACKSWDYLNRYTPEAVLTSMGFHPNIMNDMANFEAALNLFAWRLSTICVPDQFDFIHRHSWLFSNIYEDENNGRAQMYIMNPSRFYIWTEGQDDKPTSLVAHPITDLYNDVEGSGIANRIWCTKQVNELIDSVLTPLFGSEDVGTMNGDLAKAFGDGGMIKINPVDMNPLIPVHNDEVLEQIMNADVLTTMNTSHITFKDLTIKQEMGNLSVGPYLTQDLSIEYPSTVTVPRNAIKSLLNAYDDISGDRVMTSTRLKFALQYMASSGESSIYSCGTEIVESMEIFFNSKESHRTEVVTVETRPLDFVQNVIAMLSKFRYHPTIYLFGTRGNSWLYRGYLQDSAITAWLDDDKIEELNNVAVLSEYAVKDFKTGLSH